MPWFAFLLATALKDIQKKHNKPDYQNLCSYSIEKGHAFASRNVINEMGNFVQFEAS